ncbi:ABC transporter substrate-binding protein [Sinanaerobacter chloroacetimidivorans]|jgi:iron(III) transport system substrate-binding protein|uniref:ABC transporter substrate-binding protein n=1 Tax=Sinanaerobacter chloroacetimidivorans TaxID=2818044 RepID=A0A8J7W6E4_9FIRM|nr:ABC transporter substrate-binding protein [Sinanaerobacter chloroacetimidivorans]MBR0600178.1 ABC transporter substrate-binding protein [Sinanaerobacter chloroacetimidivorans]
MFTKRIRMCALLLAVMMVMATAAGCGSSATNSDGGQGGDEKKEPAYKELTVYSALPETELPFYFNAFTQDTGIKVNYVRLSAGEMLTRVKAEASNPNASVMYGGSTDNFIAAAKDGLLEPYSSPELANVPDEYKDPDAVWSPFYVGALAFACNKDWFEKNNLEYPKTWQDLLKPEFKGQISMAHPSTSGTSFTILATIVQMMGEDKAWDYLAKLNKNVRQYTKAGAAPPMEVALGEAAIALTFSHDGLKPANEGYPIEVVFPEDGTGYEVGAIALIKGGAEKEQENAKLFIDWVLSQRGQECFIESKSNRLPINVNAKVSDGLEKISDINVIDYDAVWSGENRTRLIEEFTAKIDNAGSLKE